MGLRDGTMRRAAIMVCILLATCKPPPLRDRNGDGIVSVAITGASNTVGRLAWLAADPPQPVPPAWDFPSVAERLTEELTAAGVIVQWWVPPEGGFSGFAPSDTSTLQGGTALTARGAATFQPGKYAGVKITYALNHADPPLDAILIGSGLEIEGVALQDGTITIDEIDAELTGYTLAADAAGYDLYILTSTQMEDCDCDAPTPRCTCCQDGGATCILFGSFAAAAEKNVAIQAVNDRIRARPIRVIDVGFPLPYDPTWIDMVHHGSAAVEAKVQAVLATLLP